ncbi:MAG: efflux RND transporter permease subunit [Gammaproteobacteria bacterium]|nr:efflux RND transporter permease subunit [Gammaproteobacteria bacterium]
MTNFNLSAWALRHQAFIRFLIAVFMIAGVLTYFSLGQKEDPDFTFRTMIVKVIWPGATAREMELQVTDKIEKKLQETPSLDYLKSYSKPEEAVVFVYLREDTPPKSVDFIWDRVRKKVGDIREELPDNILGPFFDDEFGDTYGSIFAFTADGFGYAELKVYVDRIRQELLRLDNVSKVDLVGEQDEKIYIELSNTKVATLGIDPLLVVSTLQAQNAMTASGTVETQSDRFFIRISGDFDSVDSISDIGIRANDRIFRLGDIARVYRGYVDPPTFRMRYLGQDAIGLAVSMTKGGDVIALGKSLQQTMQRLMTEIPVGIEVHQVSDQPAVVRQSVNEFTRSLLEALLIVLAVSFLSLGVRSGLVVALSIPLVLAIVFLVMKFYGIDLQRISLGALIIALGLLVDDAIIAVEMMSLKLEEGWDRIRAATFAYTSTAFPMLTGTLITALAFLPIGLARSSAGEYTFSIFAVVTIALLASWLVAVVFTPYIGYMLLPEARAHVSHEEIYQKPFYARFRRWVAWCVQHRTRVILATIAAFAAAIVAFKTAVEQQFFPASARPELLVDLWLPEGSTFESTENEVKNLEKHLMGDGNVVNYVSYVGGGSPRFYLPLDPQLSHLNYAQMIIMTSDLEAREATLKKLRDILDNDFPLVRGRASRLENGPPVGYPVQFRVIGDDPETLRTIAAGMAGAMRANASIRNVNTDWNEMIKAVRLDVDQDKARTMGLSSQDIAQTTNAILSGFAVTQYRELDRSIDVVIRARQEDRENLGALGELTIHNAEGKAVPLSQLVTVSQGFEEGIIWRRNRFPAITVRADIPDHVQAPDVAAQLLPAMQEIAAGLPDGYRIEMGGAQESSARAQASIKAVVPFALVLILVLLMVQLQSFQRTLLVLLTAPLGLIGVTIALLVLQRPFGFVAMLGVIALAGMIMRNSVILVDQIEQDIKAGHSPYEAIIEATVRRFRPIMLTAAAAILAMIPLTHSTFWGPMAVAIMGGLLVATVLTLFFLPALYAAWFRVRQPA